MAKYLILRLLDAIPTVFLVLLLVFIAMRILPGDPAIAALGDMATTEQLQMFRERMGLNEPLWLQFINFVKGVLTLDFGTSMMSNNDVVALIAYNLPYTIELTIVAMLMGIIAGVPLGVMAATHRNKAPDAAVRGFSLIGYAIPDFYLGALLLITFALNLGWFPINGGGEGFADRMYHVFLPALTLAFVKARLHRPADPHLAARGARQGLHPHGARQGRQGEPGDLPPRPAQRAAAAHHRPRAQPARHALRLGGDRARLQPPGHRQAADRRHRRARLPGDPGRRRRLRHVRRGHQPADGPPLHRRRPAHPGALHDRPHQRPHPAARPRGEPA